MTDYRVDNNEGDITLAYGIGLKQLSNGKTLVLMIVRGTKDFISNEMLGNLAAGANNIGEHMDFSATANTLYGHLMGFLNTVGKELNPQLDTQKFSNIQFVITGHSRGAAVANILAKNLSEIEDGEDDNVYAYTFACPDTAMLTSAKIARYPTIFNIGNAKDIITWIPRAVWQKSGEKDGWGKDSYWNKYGYNTYWFCDNWNNYNEENRLPVPIDIDGQHLQGKYLEYLRKEKPVSEYRKREQAMQIADLRPYHAIGWFVEKVKNAAKPHFIMVHFWCPVNVEVYTSDGKLVGKIINNEASDLLSERISVYIEDDQKYICLLDDDDYTFKVIGTDIGVMDYGIQRIDTSSYETISEKQFLNVAIAPQKQMVSNIAINDKESISDIKLYVCDEAGKITKEVQADGSGTEISVVDKIENPDSTDPGNTDTNTPGNNTSNPETNKPNPINPGTSGSQTKPTIKVKKIILSGISHQIAAGKKVALTASVLPSNATDKTVVWKSSNSKVATVSNKGVVSMKRTGKGKTATITAIAKDGSGTKATYKIKCMKGIVKKISISGQKVRSAKAGSTIKLQATVNASKNANKTLKWISSNKKYATVNNKGKVTVKKAGKNKTVKIMAMAADGGGKKASAKIKIK